jgi:nucleotide-binding universal stress UspA family protein
MSIFPTKILLATDGSEEAELALLTAVDLADRTDSELHVIHVGGDYHPGPEIALSPALLEETLRELEREAREVLEGQVKKIEEAGGIVADAHLKMGGRPDEQIVELAEELGIGLIAMGSRGFGGIRRALLGSVSDSVVRHAHCPVLVVRRRTQEEHQEEARSIFPTKILLATDGSEEANLAALTTIDIANKTGSELHVIHVGFSPVPIGAEVAPVAAVSRLQDELNEEATRFLDQQVEQIEAAGGTVAQAHLGLTGRPDEEIVELAELINAGLIAMGSRGLGGIRRALMGSVSDSVVRHAHCPVLIARAEKGPRRNLEDRDSTTRQPRREGAEDKRSFWDMLFGPYPSEREEKVLEYIVHRLGDGARLEEIVQEQYVRRYASPEEVSDILENHRLVEGARKKLEENFEELSRALRVRGRDNG